MFGVMPVTDEARCELYDSLVGVIGESPAQTLMELTRAMDTSQLITRDDFSDLRSDVAKLGAQLFSLAERVDERFEQVDRRFEQVDKRFEHMDERLERNEERLTTMDERFKTLDDRLHTLYLRLISVVWAFTGVLVIGFLSVIAAILATR